MEARYFFIDLTTGEKGVRTYADPVLRKHLGGSGIAARILWETGFRTPPLSEESVIVISAGLLTGTGVPSASKLSVCARSPLTGLWNEATVGGGLGAELRKTGYFGLIIRGRAEAPVCLYLDGDGLSVLPAGALWGMDAYESDEALRALTDERAETLLIGPAGERMVSLAALIAGGRKARAAGRGGLGAVFGSKNLKGIAIRGRGRVETADPDSIRAGLRELSPEIRRRSERSRRYGTAGSVEGNEANGDLPIKNWQLRSWPEGASRICGQALVEKGYVTGNYSCRNCQIACGKDVAFSHPVYGQVEGHGPEYEAAASLGSLLLNDDPVVLMVANDLCNRLGIDVISTGAAIALAMECHEAGLLGSETGWDLSWGRAETIIGLVREIGLNEGLGRRLGRGTRLFAREVGGDAPERTMEVKGLELAMHDPRAFPSLVLNYATGNRGGCHLESLSHVLEGGRWLGPVGVEEGEGLPGLVLKMQDLMSVYNALGLCKFLRYDLISPELLAHWVRCVTGWDMTASELLRAGSRAFNLKRLMNFRLGATAEDDSIPARVRRHYEKEDLDLDALLRDFYRLRGWGPDGHPHPATLEGLGLAGESLA